MKTLSMMITNMEVHDVGMSLMLYNTLTKKKESFKPLRNKLVRIYFCGPTVQDVPHIGHARAYVAFDVLIRYLRYLGYRIMYVRNVTDIDDKIIRKANELKITPFEVAEMYWREFYEISKALNLIPPNIEPRATGHIPEIIELIKKLIEKGYAYVTNKGDVYFDVLKFKEYGKLSGQKIEELQAGARIEPGEDKRNPLDFALWKAAKPGEPSWPSPWGPGRPGWHIECSAMSLKYLGETIDIHAGGADLIFPHHENEIAQSEAATGKPFARFWVHIGLLNIKEEKMSKSLGNIIPVREVLRRYDAETIRYWIAKTHYRKPLNFEWKQLDEAEVILDKMYSIIFKAENEAKKRSKGELGIIEKEVARYEKDFLNAMNDDLNTPKALSILRNLVEYLDKNLVHLNKTQIEFIIGKIRELGWIFGILQQDLEERIDEKKLRGKDISKFAPPGFGLGEKLAEELLDILIDVRSELRRRKIFDLADSIREKLRVIGIVLEDTKEGTIWKIS